ncbi:hypothetical protein Q5P01_025523 [Channa striata]|uniref:Ig-like domain-containing protein n=1 Tax=Channa striata TaxID=64152 RepID=A0AA88IIQ0_CHASR|nr:hypothetical protein Q5P01_025523 [Channa striata]
MTEWDTLTTCYYNSPNEADKQCCTILPVTVYKPPDSVSISISDHSGLMLEGRQYTLQCEVRNAAPIQNLSVTFYRGNTPLGRPGSVNSAGKKPASETYAWSIVASKEDDGAQYWCEAELELGPEGPQPPPMMKSQHVTTTVQYKPRLLEESHPKSITIKEGSPLKLNCSAVGNPQPKFTWTFPAEKKSTINGSVLTVASVTSADKGQFTCTASNSLGNQTVTFKVDVQRLSSTAPNRITGSNVLHVFTLGCALLLSVLV